MMNPPTVHATNQPPISTLDAAYVLKLQKENADLQRQLRDTQRALYHSVATSGNVLLRVIGNARGVDANVRAAQTETLRTRMALGMVLEAIANTYADTDAEPQALRDAEFMMVQVLSRDADPEKTRAALTHTVQVLYSLREALEAHAAQIERDARAHMPACGTLFVVERTALANALNDLRNTKLMPDELV